MRSLNSRRSWFQYLIGSVLVVALGLFLLWRRSIHSFEPSRFIAENQSNASAEFLPKRNILAIEVFRDKQENCCSSNTDLQLWNPSTGKMLQSIDAEECWMIAFSPDGQYIAGSDIGDTVRVWEVDTRKMARVIKIPLGNTVCRIQFLTDNRTVVVTCLNGGDVDSIPEGLHLYFLDTKSGRLIKMLNHIAGTADIQLAPDGKSTALTYIAKDNIEPLHNWKGDARLRRQSVLENDYEDDLLKFSPDGRWFVTRSEADDSLKVYDWKRNKLLYRLTPPSLEGFSDVVFLPRSKQIIAASAQDMHNDNPAKDTPNSAHITVADLYTGHQLKSFSPQVKGYPQISVSGDEKMLAILSNKRVEMRRLK